LLDFQKTVLNDNDIINRRKFLRRTLGYSSLLVLPAFTNSCQTKPLLRFGIVTDIHYADREHAGTRYYRQSEAKLQECVELMNAEEVDFLVELGDFKDQDMPPDMNSTINYLEDIEKVYAGFKGPRYHVLGNHDVDSISKKQFLSKVTNTGIPENKSYYYFDKKGVRFVVLDANFTSDGTDYDSGNFHWEDANIPAPQLEWLSSVLNSDLPVVLFVHQLLDGTGSHYIKNASEVREILNGSTNVLAVFQGHQHDGQYNLIDNIHYYTLHALVDGSGQENSSYAIAEIFPDSTMKIKGYRKAKAKILD